jgi:hypothetical protein
MCFVAVIKLRVKRGLQFGHFDQCSTEGSEEDLNRRQQRKQRSFRSWGLRHSYPVGPLASLQSSSRLRWCSRMRRPMSVCLPNAPANSVCLPIGLGLLRRGCEPLRSMLNRRQRREFEQKAAKETKVIRKLGLRRGHPVGPSAPLRSSSPSLRSRRTRSRAACRAEPNLTSGRKLG